MGPRINYTKKIRAEFHEYAKRLQKIKRDVEKIMRSAAATMTEEDQLEEIIPCLKRILEQIVYGCLAVQIPVYGKSSVSRWGKKKPIELVKMVDEGRGFYPNPEPGGTPYVKIAKSLRDGDVLTKERWFTGMNFVNQVQHVQNPASNRRKPDTMKALADALKWTQRAINLLSCHTIMTEDTRFFGRAIMHTHTDSRAQVLVYELDKPWSPVYNLPDGGMVELVRRDANGEYQRIQAPEGEAGVTVMWLHGIYTHDRFVLVQQRVLSEYKY